jgi:hypothetical protein
VELTVSTADRHAWVAGEPMAIFPDTLLWVWREPTHEPLVTQSSVRLLWLLGGAVLGGRPTLGLMAQVLIYIRLAVPSEGRARQSTSMSCCSVVELTTYAGAKPSAD